MTIQEATSRFESWLERQTPLDRSHLALKHKLMSKGAFPFLRATFYRWIQLLAAVCPELIAAPKVLAVGDLHIENFGTWRDHEGRLVWVSTILTRRFRCLTRRISCVWQPVPC